MFRLHIDIELGHNQEQSVFQSEMIMKVIQEAFESNQIQKDINYRLGNDTDRQKSNYLMMNENGHASNKKLKIVLQPVTQDESDD